MNKKRLFGSPEKAYTGHKKKKHLSYSVYQIHDHCCRCNCNKNIFKVEIQAIFNEFKMRVLKRKPNNNTIEKS